MPGGNATLFIESFKTVGIFIAMAGGFSIQGIIKLYSHKDNRQVGQYLLNIAMVLLAFSFLIIIILSVKDRITNNQLEVVFVIFGIIVSSMLGHFTFRLAANREARIKELELLIPKFEINGNTITLTNDYINVPSVIRNITTNQITCEINDAPSLLKIENARAFLGNFVIWACIIENLDNINGHFEFNAKSLDEVFDSSVSMSVPRIDNNHLVLLEKGNVLTVKGRIKSICISPIRIILDKAQIISGQVAA